MSDPQQTHVVISAPSQWGQQACDHLLHRWVAHGGRITLIVPRRDEERFGNSSPSFKEWQHHASLKACLEQLRTSGRPIDYLFDDQTNHLAATLISQCKSNSHLTVGYVTSSAEDHLAHARFLSQFCERVLVEKPVSRIFSELQPDSELSQMAKAVAKQGGWLGTAEHYLFRPGVTSALGPLAAFLERHRRCNLRYEFHFTEPAGRDDPSKRVGSYQDGSILDVLAPHGLGPVARLFAPMLGIPAEAIDFHEDLTWSQVRSWQATEPNGSLTVPVLAETAAELRGTLRLKTGQTLDLLLRSAKGCRTGLRYFKFSCPIDHCNYIGEQREQVRSDLGVRSGAAEDCLYFGVSLGSAGYTVLDYIDSKEQFFEERDGGFKSDTRGNNSEAANAQAAMLDALLSRSFDEDSGRFVPVETACQLMRAGIDAQGLALNRKPCQYVWGAGPKWSRDRKGDVPPLQPLRHVQPGIEQLYEVLGTATSPARNRVVTILGSEGTGNSDVARALSKKLGALLIQIPRDETWDRADAGSSESVTLETVLRDLATALHLPITTACRPADELLKHLRRVGERLPEKGILLFNGVDRLSPRDWPALVRILNHLSSRQRMIFVTKQWDRAAGLVVRTEELIDALISPEIKRLKAPPLEDYFPAAALQSAEAIRKRFARLWARDLLPFSKNNLTVRQQVASYIIYIALPAVIQKQGIPLQQGAWWAVNPNELNWHDLRKYVLGEIASLDIPAPLVPFPEAVLDRLSLFCLAMVGEEDRAAIRSLAALSGAIPRELIDAVRPGLFARLAELQPVRALFEQVEEHQALLFPRVRRAALTCSPEQLAQLRAEIERRRMILALHRLRRSSPDPRRLDGQMIRLLYGASLESLNLDRSPFEACCMKLVADGEQSAGSLIELLTDGSSLSKTSLGLLARARFTRLKGCLLCSAAGMDPPLLHQATEVLDHALALAQYCAHRKRGSVERETLILAIQGRVFAGLVQIRCWHRLLEVGAAPRIEKQEWMRFVAPDQSHDEHSLWKLCALDVVTGSLLKKLPLSASVVAVAARLLALYTAACCPEWAPLHPTSLCLTAARLNEDAKGDCRARNLLEAALLLPGGQRQIEDRWGLNASEGGLTRRSLRDMAREGFEQEQEAHRGLASYMAFLDRILAAKDGESELPNAEELAGFEMDFERRGEAYFTQLARDMKSSRQE